MLYMVAIVFQERNLQCLSTLKPLHCVYQYSVWLRPESTCEETTQGHGGYRGYDFGGDVTALLEYPEAGCYCNQKNKHVI